jgi:type I restriction enzyme S subunit
MLDERYRVRPGDILVSWSATLDAFVWRGEEAWLNQHIFKVVPNRELVSERFLHYLLKNAIAALVTSEHLHGSTMRHINRKPFLAHKVRLPSLRAQDAIAAKIDELFSDLDAGVAALERARANLKRYRAAVLKAAVEGELTEQWRNEHPDVEPASKLLERILAERRKKWEEAQLAKYAAADKTPPNGWKEKYSTPVMPRANSLPQLPDKWCWATVDQLLIEPACNGVSVRGSDNPPGIASLRLNAMSDSGFDFSQRRYIPLPEKTARELAIRMDDFFVSRGNGSLRLVGRGTLAIEPNELIVFPDTMIRLRFIDNSLAKLLAHFWPSRFIRNQVEAKARTSAGIYKISQGDLMGFHVPLPSAEEQEAIVQEIEDQLSVIDKSEEQIARALIRATSLRQSILKRAFEGKLVPQDPNDEPASVLLERIRAARAAAAPPARNGRGKRIRAA